MKNLILFPVVLLSLLQNLAAQNINGFQIFVSKKQFTSIEFHSDITNLAFAQKGSPYKIIFMGAKTIFLETSQDVKVPYDLSILEGGRNHKFVIIYSEDVDQSKRDNDYSNLNQLKALISKFVTTNSSTRGTTKKNVSPGSSAKEAGNKDPAVPSSASPANLNFYILIDQADKARKSGQLQTAKAKYKQALGIQPDNSYALTYLQRINEAIQKESETKYNNAIIKARQESANNNYDEAIKGFFLALEAKPGDRYATNEIASLQKKIETAKIEKDNLQKENLYDSYLKAGDKALRDKSYEAATIAYNEALKIKPGNEYVMSQVSKVQQAIVQAQADSIKQQEEQNRIAAIDNKDVTDSMKTGTDTSAADVVMSAVRDIETGMLLIKARLFKMGSDVGSTDESPVHAVKLDSFYISRFEVTQSQWQSIMGNNPSFFKDCDDCPVENVSWNDAMKFIEQLNQITHKNYRLPSEAEWEYIAGTQNKKDNIDNIAWYNDNAKGKTHHIGLLQPDFLGVYDIFGNVAEWCSDWYSYSAYRKDLAVNPTGPGNGKEKVVRGGSWYDMGGSLRPSVRDKVSPDKADKKTGFRLAMSLN